jgi:hypothetical protein
MTAEVEVAVLVLATGVVFRLARSPDMPLPGLIEKG